MTQDELVISLRLFGEFRQYFEGDFAEITLPRGAGIQDLREAFKAAVIERNPGVADVGVVNRAAIADENAILDSDFVFEQDMTLAVLPPMCGG